MAASWQPAVTGYLGRIAKPAILQALSSATMIIMPMMMTTTRKRLTGNAQTPTRRTLVKP